MGETKEKTTAKGKRGCGVVQGIARQEGETWQKDVCTHCSCKVSDFVFVIFKFRAITLLCDAEDPPHLLFLLVLLCNLLFLLVLPCSLKMFFWTPVFAVICGSSKTFLAITICT